MSKSPEFDPEKVPVPAIDDFAEVLADEPRWYDLGIYLEISSTELNEIRLNHNNDGIQRCLIEIFKIFRFRQVPVTWHDICEALLRMDNESLAERIRENYILRTMKNYPETPPISEPDRGLEGPSNGAGLEGPGNGVAPHPIHDAPIIVEKSVTEEFHRLLMFFNDIILGVRRGLERSDLFIEDLQFILQEHCDLRPLPDEVATIERIFARLHPHYCFLNYHLLSFLTERFLPDERLVQDELDEYADKLEEFKDIPKVIDLMKIIKGKRDAPGGPRLISLKLREFWGKVTLRKFEKLARLVFHKIYKKVAHLRIVQGCIRASWTLSNISNVESQLSDLVQSTEFMDAIGVMSLTIDDSVLFESPVDEDLEDIEEAILYSLKVGNHEAIDFLLETIYDAPPSVKTPELDEGKSTQYAKMLQYACGSGHTQVVFHLLDLDMGWFDHDCMYLCIVAATESNQQQIIKLLLKFKHEVTPLHLASEKGHVGVVSILLKCGADPNAEMYSSNQWTPLMLASARGHVAVVTELLRNDNIEVNKKTNGNISALGLAMKHDHPDIVHLLVACGAFDDYTIDCMTSNDNSQHLVTTTNGIVEDNDSGCATNED